MRSPHLIRPPQPRMLQPQLCKFLRREFHDLRFPAAQFHGLMKFFPSNSARNTPFTGSFEMLRTSPLIVSSAVLYCTSSLAATNGFRTATSPLDLRKTSFQIPMSLSGGVGFQSTQVIPKSDFPAAKTSSAMAFTLPGCKYLLTSNSYERYVPATSFASANLCPLIQMLAR